MKVLRILWIILKSIILGIISYPIFFVYCYFNGDIDEDNLWLVALVIHIIAFLIVALMEIFQYLKKDKTK